MPSFFHEERRQELLETRGFRPIGLGCRGFEKEISKVKTGGALDDFGEL